MAQDLDAWRGSTEEAHDVVTDGLLDRWAATVLAPIDALPGTGTLAPCAHWATCLPADHTLAGDGHPPKGGFLPPVALPRRMWAGGRIEWLGELRADDSLTRHSTVSAIEAKHGRSGNLVFVTVTHEIRSAGAVMIRERQDIVYRDSPSAATAATVVPTTAEAEPSRCDVRHTITPTAPWLFRFSALTFNAHRIHYDRPFATTTEGYRGLVVHGPLLAALMASEASQLTARRGRRLRSMDFRSSQPVVDIEPLDVCAVHADDEAIEAWIEVAGVRCSAARLTVD
jgi:3-methylfumaryl-CoA hydratase